jgi:hypothetical protein
LATTNHVTSGAALDLFLASSLLAHLSLARLPEIRLTGVVWIDRLISASHHD